MVNATHRCDKTVNLEWRPKYSIKSSSSPVNLEISMSSASCETELAEWKGGAAREDTSQVVHSRYCSSFPSKSGFYSSIRNIFLHSNIIVVDFSKPALLGFPPTCDSTLEPGFYRGFSLFINFHFLELSCETFTLGEVSCFLF